MAFNSATYLQSVTATNETVGTSSAAITAEAGIRAIKFKAAAANAGTIHIGQTGTATTSMWPLAAGDETDWLPASNASDYAAIASQASQSLFVLTLR